MSTYTRACEYADALFSKLQTQISVQLSNLSNNIDRRLNAIECQLAPDIRMEYQPRALVATRDPYYQLPRILDRLKDLEEYRKISIDTQKRVEALMEWVGEEWELEVIPQQAADYKYTITYTED